MITIKDERNTVSILQRCMFCNEGTRVMVDADDYHRWQGGELIQNVWPDAEPEERELIRTGAHPACWPQDHPQ
ncbi:hypothetical protein DWB68_13320 [Galactobacter valiniphilus]|uniref:Uncharacterized protein n=1 Tax=Galactobacter valiniphilus TaxID=2676122 RepID=A0A399JFM5_9MICC|nr:hypothetical protein [Galactobacter valiniphilus]RII41316.1 hypothetical protein DWB68_13320 [Galactobacter valiniphilus]